MMQVSVFCLNARCMNQRYECRMAFGINGMKPVWASPGSGTPQIVDLADDADSKRVVGYTLSEPRFAGLCGFTGFLSV